MENVMISLPNNLENLQLPDPNLLTYYMDEDKRCLWIEDEIDGTLFEISKQIIRYNREDQNVPVEQRIPIKLFINSPGGDLDVTLAFIGLISISKTPIWTIDTGMAYSAAGLILMSGNKRFALPNSQCLIHSGSGVCAGSYESTTEQMKNYKTLVDKMRDFILSHTQIDQKLFRKNSTKDWYITTQEMLDYGIVNRIVESIDEII